MTWYTRAPTTPPTTTQMATSANSLAVYPRRTQRVSATFAATSTPIASISP